jgi:hypothetical protein
MILKKSSKFKFKNFLSSNIPVIEEPNKPKLYFPKLQNTFITITIRYISLRIQYKH